MLYYYKTKDDKSECGSMDLDKATGVRPFDQSADCTTFEVYPFAIMTECLYTMFIYTHNIII
jgi:hypothetical protein